MGGGVLGNGVKSQRTGITEGNEPPCGGRNQTTVL